MYHNPENRTDNQTDKLKWIEASCRELYKAYQLKEQIHTAILWRIQIRPERPQKFGVKMQKTSESETMVELAKKIEFRIYRDATYGFLRIIPITGITIRMKFWSASGSWQTVLDPNPAIPRSML